MADFRRWVTVLAVLALFAGLASAQIGGGTGATAPFTCSLGSGSVTPQLRGEGYTELVGDIVLTCQGGPTYVAGTLIPKTNIVVSMGAPVTSRLLNGSTSQSEALLLVDEPGVATLNAPVSNFGPQAPQILCTTPTTGCTEYVGISGTTEVPVTDPTGALPDGGVQTAPNVFQGIVSGNQITFNGVPILPPATTGISRVYRITNVRINANALYSAGSVVQAVAQVSTNGSTALPLQNPVLVVGFVQTGLTASVRSFSTNNPYRQCEDVALSDDALPSNARTAQLRFLEAFDTAFKTRVAPLSDVTFAGQDLNLSGQNVPGGVANSESGFIFQVGAAQAGLADFGTRLKAVFNNVPTGVRLFVSTANVGVTYPAGYTVGGTGTTTFAQLVTSETASDGFGAPPLVGGTFNFSTGLTSGSTFTAGTISASEVPIVGGQGTAVWEILNANPNALDTADFNVYIAYEANTAANTPLAPSLATVKLSYAPTPSTAAGFTATQAAKAQGGVPIPRFADTSTAADVLQVTICQTQLLWPFVVARDGLDTGIAISNTSLDTYNGLDGQSGTCTLYFYPNTQADGKSALPSVQYPAADQPQIAVALGSTWATNVASIPDVGASFVGYVIGVCNFQYAHGYAAVADIGLRNFYSNYLALVLNANAGLLRNGDTSGAAEQLVH